MPLASDAYLATYTFLTGASLNALADGGWATSEEFWNYEDGPINMRIFFLGSALFSPANGSASRIDVYVLPGTVLPSATIYPTSYADVTETTGETYHEGVIQGRAGTNTFRSGSVIVRIPEGPYKIQIENNLGVALPTSANNFVYGSVRA